MIDEEDTEPGSEPANEAEAPRPDAAEQARCALHPQAPSTDTCAHCGNFGCDDCLGTINHKLVCHTCVLDGRVLAYEGIPWERRDELGMVTALWQSVRDLTLRPQRFFAALDPNGSVSEAMGFLALCLIPMALVIMLLFAGLGGVMTATTDTISAGEGALVSVLLMFYGPMAWVGLFVGALFWGLVNHLMLMLFGSGSAGLNGSLRVTLYASGVYAWNIVPCLGSILGLWAVVLTCVGLQKAHQDPTWKPVAAVLSPVCLCLGSYFILYFGVVMASIAGGL